MKMIVQHIRVMAALIVREMSTRYGGKPGGYLWALVDPVAHVAFMTAIFQTIARAPAVGTSFPLFFASGYLPFTFYQAMQGYVAGTINANRALLNYPVVAPLDAVISRYIVQLMTTLLVSVLVFAFVAYEDHVSLHLDAANIIGACFVASLIGLGVGLVNSALFARSKLYEQVYGVVTRPMFLVSGVFFIPDALPKPFSTYLLWNPLVHIVMWFRTGVYGEYRAYGLDVLFLVKTAAVLLFAGLLFFTFSAQHLREERL
ncbi:ABC transporter permease [Sinorhizobium meliloti]|uniref:ABC transporter permease n=1 Tax=Rhizobium meliloti TaxID=382 RepID=UPI000FDC533B|nr:ABC transporter permease [Sinorhizobium meliloti]RVP15541.1 ABC transporter permease [Sinorhizobium meliloti]